jgi:hypothetical protein
MHMAAITPENMIKMLHWQYFHSLTVTLGISLIKISVATFLLRLVPGKGYKMFLYCMIGMFLHNRPFCKTQADILDSFSDCLYMLQRRCKFPIRSASTSRVSSGQVSSCRVL